MYCIRPLSSTLFRAFLLVLVLLSASSSSHATCTADPSHLDRSIVTLTTPAGEICLQLYDDLTPNTVATFLDYISSGDWDDMIFQRLAKNFVLQAGGFKYDGSSFVGVRNNPPWIDGEWEHAENSNKRGTIAMALSSGPDSATNNWFINWEDNDGTSGGTPNLDDNSNGGPFTVFGKVVADAVGYDTMNVVDAINALDTLPNDNIPRILSGTVSILSALTNLPLTSQPVETGGAYGCFDSSRTARAIDPALALDPEAPGIVLIDDPVLGGDFWLSEGCASAGPSTDLGFYTGNIPDGPCGAGDQYLALAVFILFSNNQFGTYLYESNVYDYSSFTCDAAQASRDGYNLWKADVGSQVISALITTSPSLTYVPEPAAFFVQLAAIATLLGLTRSRSRQV